MFDPVSSFLLSKLNELVWMPIGLWFKERVKNYNAKKERKRQLEERIESNGARELSFPRIWILRLAYCVVLLSLLVLLAGYVWKSPHIPPSSMIVLNAPFPVALEVAGEHGGRVEGDSKQPVRLKVEPGPQRIVVRGLPRPADKRVYCNIEFSFTIPDSEIIIPLDVSRIGEVAVHLKRLRGRLTTIDNTDYLEQNFPERVVRLCLDQETHYGEAFDQLRNETFKVRCQILPEPPPAHDILMCEEPTEPRNESTYR